MAERWPTTFYSAHELAELWRCSDAYVYRQLRSGALRGFKAGGGWRVSEESRLMFEKSKEEEAQSRYRRLPAPRLIQ